MVRLSYCMIKQTQLNIPKMVKEELHVVMLPWSAFGHLIPFFRLSMALAKAKVHVSFISTPRNIQRLPKFPLDLQPFLHLVSIPFPPLDPDFLPEGAEATIDVPGEKSGNLMIAYDLLQAPISQFVADQKPDWIVSDFAPYWVVDIAKECDVPLLYFSVFSAAASVFFGPAENLTGANRDYALPTPRSLTSPPEWITFPSLVAFKEHEAVYVPKGFWGANSRGISSVASRLAKIISASQVLTLRTCNEIEGEYLEVYEKITGKPVIPTGVLLSPDQPRKRAEEEPDAGIFYWLDKQKPKSVVFVGFGSEVKLSKEQVHEIAHGLELSELPFIWGLRIPSPTRKDEANDFLPLGFADRTSDKGHVCFGWVPQMQILAHPSIGGSLIHVGWSSVIETLLFGHCLVVLPMIFDQPLNARLLVEKGLAVEVRRNEDGSFSGEEVAKSLRLAMVEAAGEEVRTSARNAGAVFGDVKLQDHYVDAFVDYLRNNIKKDVTD